MTHEHVVWWTTGKFSFRGGVAQHVEVCRCGAVRVWCFFWGETPFPTAWQDPPGHREKKED